MAQHKTLPQQISEGKHTTHDFLLETGPRIGTKSQASIQAKGTLFKKAARRCFSVSAEVVKCKRSDIQHCFVFFLLTFWEFLKDNNFDKFTVWWGWSHSRGEIQCRTSDFKDVHTAAPSRE